MLLNLYKKKWNDGLKNQTGSQILENNSKNLAEMKRLTKDYKEWIKKENSKTLKEFEIESVGKLNPKRHL